MRRFYAPISSFAKHSVLLGAEETRHLRDVLRLRSGAEVYVIDGQGREFRCRVENVGKKSTELAIVEACAPTAPESRLDLTLAVAILRADKFDLVIQKATELGVTRLVPLITERCEVKATDAAKKLDRWGRIVLEASKQSGRARLMGIERPTRFVEFIGSSGSHAFVFTESGGGELQAKRKQSMLTAVVGPAGGWEDSELALSRSAGATLVTLGGRILRAETAAITAAVLLQHRFGDLN